MIATNEETLGDLFTAAIVGITPRLTYQGAEGWKPYERETSNPTISRRFRLVWEAGNLRPGGAMFGSIHEHEATLRVRTDYAGVHDRVELVAIDDFHQLADTLTTLKANDNGLQLVTRLRVEAEIGDTQEGDDVVRVDHVYSVRYMRRIQL